jgi:hypothetical protein
VQRDVLADLTEIDARFLFGVSSISMRFFRFSISLFSSG